MATQKLTKREQRFKIVVPKEVEEKIRYVCMKIHEVEWSGVLFYSYSGNIDDKTLIIRCEDFYLMDKGSCGYTEYDFGPEVAQYMTFHPELLDCQIGHIHSHNNMNAFFSGTDQDTLAEFGAQKNNFVSLIVNNAGVYCAGMTRKIVHTLEGQDCIDTRFFGDETQPVCKNFKTTTVEVEWYDLDIEKEESLTDRWDIDERLSEIQESKKKAEFEKLKKKDIFKPLHNFRYNMKDMPMDSDIFSGEKLDSDIKRESVEETVKDSDVDYDLHKYDNREVESIIAQILTGSVFINHIDDKNVWADRFHKNCVKRFGNVTEFKTFIVPFIDFLMETTTDDMLMEKLQVDDAVAICAFDVVSELEKLPKNVYLDAVIDELGSYII